MRIRYVVVAILLVLSIAAPAVYHHSQQKKHAAGIEAEKQFALERTRPPGEHLLELARVSPKLLTVQDSLRRVDNLLARLGVPPAVRKQYAQLDLREVRSVEGPYSGDQVTGTLLVAGGPVHLRAATDSVIVSPGPVQVQAVSASLLVSGATVRIDADPGDAGTSVIVARDKVAVASTVRGTQLYALAGAVLPRWGFTDGVVAYSTSINAEFPGQVTESPASGIFAEEKPRQAAATPPAAVPPADGHSADAEPPAPLAAGGISHGERCDRRLSPNTPDAALVAAAKRQANCETIDSMEVRCLSVERAADGYLLSEEEWEFQMCSRKILATIDRRTRGKVETDLRDATTLPEK